MLLGCAAHAAQFTIDSLMQMLAQTRSDHAVFSEKKYVAILDKPVEARGELFYRAPDHLEKRTLQPRPESMILDQGILLIERGRQKHRLELQAYPELAAFVNSIRGTLAGDRKALEQSFHLSLEGTAESWQLQLTPISEKMQSVIRRILISGTRDAVHSIETSQADGDRSVMKIERLARQ
jgi:hypothetical protein